MRNLRRLGEETHDPMQGIANLFDVGLVFALGFMLALLSYLGLPQVLSQKERASQPPTAQREIPDKKQVKLDQYRMSHEKLAGEGTRLGVAYRLASGEVVCVPESDSPNDPSRP